LAVDVVQGMKQSRRVPTGLWLPDGSAELWSQRLRPQHAVRAARACRVTAVSLASDVGFPWQRCWPGSGSEPAGSLSGENRLAQQAELVGLEKPLGPGRNARKRKMERRLGHCKRGDVSAAVTVKQRAAATAGPVPPAPSPGYALLRMVGWAIAGRSQRWQGLGTRGNCWQKKEDGLLRKRTVYARATILPGTEEIYGAQIGVWRSTEVIVRTDNSWQLTTA
jgi:hypothetical protein